MGVRSATRNTPRLDQRKVQGVGATGDLGEGTTGIGHCPNRSSSPAVDPQDLWGRVATRAREGFAAIEESGVRQSEQGRTRGGRRSRCRVATPRDATGVEHNVVRVDVSDDAERAYRAVDARDQEIERESRWNRNVGRAAQSCDRGCLLILG